MRRGPDQLNRALLVLVSLALLAAGGYGLARGYGAFGDLQADEPLLLEPVRDWVGRNGNWFWPVAFLVSVAVAYVSLRWLLAQFRAPRITEIDLTREGSKGSTRLRASGAAQALARDIESYREVSSASARLVDDGERPEVDVRIEVHDDADVPGLRARVEDQALRRFCRALEVPAVTARLDLQLIGPTERTVR